MSFGLGFFGVRISTRGVRVGPSFLNVKIGRGGPRIGVGPRIARIRLGKKGAGISSGLGPLYVSSRGVGVHVGGIPLSKRRIGVQVPTGAFWFGGKFARGGFHTGGVIIKRRHAAASRSGLMSSSSTFVQVSPILKRAHTDYESQLAGAGVKRRNRFEVRSAGAESIFWELSTIVAFTRRFQKVNKPNVPPIPTEIEIHEKSQELVLKKLQFQRWRKDGSISRRDLTYSAKKNAKKSGMNKPFTKNRSNAILSEREKLKKIIGNDLDLIGAEYIQLRSDLKAKIANFESSIQIAFSKFDQLDNMVLGIVMQAILAKNPIPATWGGYQNGCGLVFVSFGDSEHVVWPEVGELGANRKIKVRERSKTSTKDLHKTILLRTLLAVGKEVLEASTKIVKVRVIAVDNTKILKTSDREVWGEISILQKDLKNLVNDQSWLHDWESTTRDWENKGGIIEDESENLFFLDLDSISQKLNLLNSHAFNHFAGNLKGNISKSSKEMVPMGRLRDIIPNDGINWKMEIDNCDYVDCIKALSTTDVNSPEFWISVYENFV